MMKKKGRAASASKKKASISPVDRSRSPSKPATKPYEFDFGCSLSFVPAAASSGEKPAFVPKIPVGSSAAVSKVSELRDLASSRSGDLTKLVDHGSSQVLKEVEAFRTRIAKRCKIQTQACLQLTEDAEKDYNKISDRIKENAELMKSSYAEHFAEVQKTASHVSEVVMPELAQSMEKAIEHLRSRYNIPASPV